MEKFGIGKNIAAFGQSKGLTQKRLGEILGFSARTISDWESENTEPSVAAIRKLVSYFEISFDELFEI